MSTAGIVFIIFLGLSALGLLLVFPIGGISVGIAVLLGWLGFWKVGIAIGIIGLFAQMFYNIGHEDGTTYSNEYYDDNDEPKTGIGIGEAIIAYALLHRSDDEDK